MSNIILYSTNCPQCKILEKKMNDKKLKYEEINDLNVMEKKGFMSVPKLEVDGIIMNFKEALNFVSSL